MAKKRAQRSAERVAAERFMDRAVHGWRVALRQERDGVWLHDEARGFDVAFVELAGRRAGTVSVLGDVPSAVAVMRRIGALTEVAPELSAQRLVAADELGELLDELFVAR